MKLSCLLKALPEAVVTGDPDIEVRKIECDSRRTTEGDLFVAVRGFQTDGHDFVDEALAKGARAVVLEQEGFSQEVTLVKVPDSRKALAILSDEFYGHPSQKMRLVGITGTNGKTTVSLLVREVFEGAGMKTGLIGTINYQVGDQSRAADRTTPESLDLNRMLAEMLSFGQQAAVVEVSSHALALDRTYGVRFNTAVFTNLSRDHLDFHRTYEQYLKAKGKLFRNLNHSTGAKAVINIDDPASEQIIHWTKTPVLTYGFSPKAMVCPLDFKLDWKGMRLLVKTPEGELRIKTSLKGKFNIRNILAAIGVGLANDLELRLIGEAIRKVQIIPGRFEQIDCGQPFSITVDYAHTPVALEALLGAVKELTSGRVILVFGCGGDRDRGKRPLMGKVASKMADICFVTSDNPRNEDPDEIINQITAGMNKRVYQVVPDRKEAIASALKVAGRTDAVVIAGKGHENHQIIGDRTIPFDDRLVVGEILQTGL